MEKKEIYSRYYLKHKKEILDRHRKYREKTRTILNSKLRIKRINVKQFCIEYKGGKCSICGYNKCYSSLDFHHLDPSKKEYNISKLIRTYSINTIKDKLIKELDKCILVCSNCHGEIEEGIMKL